AAARAAATLRRFAGRGRRAFPPTQAWALKSCAKPTHTPSVGRAQDFSPGFCRQSEEAAFSAAASLFHRDGPSKTPDTRGPFDAPFRFGRNGSVITCEIISFAAFCS